MYAELYEQTVNYLLNKISIRPCFNGQNPNNILNRYLSGTDDRYLGLNGGLTLNNFYCRFLMHAQNTSHPGSVIQFKTNLRILDHILFGFNPLTVSATYTNDDVGYAQLCEIFSQELPLVHNVATNSDGYKYAKTAIQAAHYFSAFNNVNDLIDSLLTLRYAAPLKLTEISGISIALASDFIKEINGFFNAFAKPDLHIIILLASFGFLPPRYTDKSYHDDAVKSFTIMVMKDIAEQMSLELHRTIYPYQLDRMWWLICTEDFFLDDDIHNKGSKKRDSFIQYILNNVAGLPSTLK